MKNIDAIHKRIQAHHRLYDLPVFAEIWEEILHKSFIDINNESEWTPTRSHAIGKDIIHKDLGKISCKSGEYNFKKKTLTINGSRTTKYKTIEEKIAFISEHNDDKYFCLSRNKKEWLTGVKRYYLFVFDSATLDYSNNNWVVTNGGWKCTSNTFNAKIVKNMSDQLWVDLKVSYINKPYVIGV
jgi:hypothetical protein